MALIDATLYRHDSTSEGSWHRWELACATIAIFLSAANFLRLDAFYFTLSDAFCCLSICMRLISGGLPVRPFGRVGTTLWFAGVLLLGFGLAFSSLFTQAPARGLVILGQYLFAYIIILFVISGRTFADTLFLARAYVLSIVLMCLHGIYVIHWSGERNTAFVSGNGRLTGFAERENECASLIALALPLLLLLASSGRVKPWVLAAAIPVMLYAILLTGSNTGLASFAYGLFVFLILNLSWKGMVAAGASIVGFLLTAWESGRDYMPVVFQRRVLSALESGDLSMAGSFQHRLELIHEALGKVESSFWIGLGADQFPVISAVRQPVHNVYLLLWTEGGAVSAIGFCVMLLGSVWAIARAFRAPGGRVVGACALVNVTLFALMANAFPHLYARFWSVPVILPLCLAQNFWFEQRLRGRLAAEGATWLRALG
ncbi:O-antigen ligase family protein [Sinorhizobium sp. NFACC03]|uniref:O-antigen ligase family protein n=1 Tax=Sinorhizobium sp. NFACC03 TaxID=1566295 RepID=UPI000880096B|nr:O-antigen ligase family protein [Sinorhizobium sp. NFACC03]SDA92784.1 hypothetical protein SAMN03159448_04843 [Sinorhizobium sp. NFACC03]